MKFLQYCFTVSLAVCLLGCDADDETNNQNTEQEPLEITDNASWMSAVIAYYAEQNITLTDICFPRAHDAGNYLETSCTIGANACNTRTQEIDIENMLLAGVREFDMRPHLFAEDNIFYTHHYTSCGGLGCNGDSFENMLQAIKSFLDTHAEIVIIDINHYCETNQNDEQLINLINNTLGNRLYKETSSTQNNVLETPLNQIISLDDNTGKAIVTYEGLTPSPEHRALGMFTENGTFTTAGSYANKFIFEEMYADQLAKFENYEASTQSLFEISWTLTQNTDIAIECAIGDSTNSIYNLATIAKENLSSSVDEMIENGTIRKGKIPNTISIDIANNFVTNECIKITKLNLEE